MSSFDTNDYKTENAIEIVGTALACTEFNTKCGCPFSLVADNPPLIKGDKGGLNTPPLGTVRRDSPCGCPFSYQDRDKPCPYALTILLTDSFVDFIPG